MVEKWVFFEWKKIILQRIYYSIHRVNTMLHRTYVGGKIGRGMIYREMSFLWCLEDSSGRYEDEK